MANVRDRHTQTESTLRAQWRLTDVSQIAATVPHDEKLALAEAEQLGKQQLVAAERLWLSECPAEALKLAATAFAAARNTASAHGRNVVGGERIVANLERLGVPLVDANVSKEQRALFRPIAKALQAEIAAISVLATTPERLRVRRARRILALALAGIAVTILAVFALRPGPRTKASASAKYSDKFSPDRTIDGDPTTEWLLPDKQEGHLDVRLLPPRSVHRVRLLPSRNAPYGDRAPRAFTLEAWNGSVLVRSIDGDFGSSRGPALWVSFDIDAPRVDRVRVVIKSHENNGGGLAEVEVE